jgi:hypothetical protein
MVISEDFLEAAVKSPSPFDTPENQSTTALETLETRGTLKRSEDCRRMLSVSMSDDRQGRKQIQGLAHSVSDHGTSLLSIASARWRCSSAI